MIVFAGDYSKIAPCRSPKLCLIDFSVQTGTQAQGVKSLPIESTTLCQGVAILLFRASHTETIFRAARS